MKKKPRNISGERELQLFNIQHLIFRLNGYRVETVTKENLFELQKRKKNRFNGFFLPLGSSVREKKTAL